MKYVVDTNIFNHLLDGRLLLSELPQGAEFVATNVQICELKAIKDDFRRAALIKTFNNLEPELVATESFALDIAGSGFDESKWSNGQRVTSLKSSLDNLKRKFNNWHDAIIAEVALVNEYGLLTNDKYLAKVAAQHGITVVCLADQLGAVSVGRTLQGSMNEQERKVMIQATFNTVASGYDNHALRYFADSANHLAKLLNLQGDEHLLDVATGTGSNALILAQQLPSGQVTGIDFSAGMLQQARAKAELSAIHNVDFVEMDMQQLSFSDNEFDVATCAFGIFFVEDMEGQLKYIGSKVKTGGKVAITCFYDNAFLPLIDLFFLRIAQFGIEKPPLAWKRISTEEKLDALFQGANLVEIRVQRKNIGYYLKDANEWWDLIWFAGFRSLVNQLSPQQLEKFKAEHLAEIQKLATTEGIWLDVEVLYAVGMKTS